MDDDFDITFKFDDRGKVKTNLSKLNYKLAFLSNEQSDQIRIHSLIGVDIIQFMENLKVTSCMQSSAWGFPGGVAPFGNSQNFLHRHQITPVKNKYKPAQNNYHTVISEFSSCSDQQINFVMDPKNTYPEPFPDIFEHSSVERKLEKMFDVDGAGSSFDKDELITDYDRSKIEKFQQSILLKK